MLSKSLMLARAGAAAAVLAIVAMVIAACGGGEEATSTAPATQAPAPTATPVPSPTPVPIPTPTPPPKYGGVLRYASTLDATHLDLHRSSEATNFHIMSGVLNWLVAVSADEGIRPDLAERWTVSPDGKTITFQLVRNAKWHDGRPVTSDDVVFSLSRIKSPELRSPWSSLLAAVDKIERVDDFTVQLSMKAPSISTLSALGALNVNIYPKHVNLADYAKKIPDVVIGSGPYKFKEWKAGVGATLVRNPDYFKKDANRQALPYLDGIEIFLIADANAEYSSYRTGRLDLTNPNSRSPLQGREKAVVQDVPGSTAIVTHGIWHFMTFNASASPWTDVRVRKALSLAFDRQAWNDVRNEGLGEPFRGLSTPGTPHAVPLEEIKTWPGHSPSRRQRDIEEAKRLIREANLTPADLKVTVPLRNTFSTVGEVAIRVLQENLGLEWSLNLVDGPTTAKIQTERLFNVYFGVTGSLGVDPILEYARIIRSGSSNNYGRWGDPAVDMQLDAIDAAFDPVKQAQLSRALEKDILVDRVWYVILGDDPWAHAWQRWVKGYKGFKLPGEGYFHQWERVWLDK